jgi:hypothetical protein
MSDGKILELSTPPEMLAAKSEASESLFKPAATAESEAYEAFRVAIHKILQGAIGGGINEVEIPVTEVKRKQVDKLVKELNEAGYATHLSNRYDARGNDKATYQGKTGAMLVLKISY